MEKYLQRTKKMLHEDWVPVITAGTHVQIDFEIQFFKPDKPGTVTGVLHKLENNDVFDSKDLNVATAGLVSHFKQNGLKTMDSMKEVGDITSNSLFFTPTQIEKRTDLVLDQSTNNKEEITRIFVTGFFYPQETHNKIYKV